MRNKCVRAKSYSRAPTILCAALSACDVKRTCNARVLNTSVCCEGDACVPCMQRTHPCHMDPGQLIGLLSHLTLRSLSISHLISTSPNQMSYPGRRSLVAEAWWPKPGGRSIAAGEADAGSVSSTACEGARCAAECIAVTWQPKPDWRPPLHSCRNCASLPRAASATSYQAASKVDHASSRHSSKVDQRQKPPPDTANQCSTGSSGGYWQ